jgi:hypothetical protein
MTPAELKQLASLPAFPGTGRELLRVAGLEAAAALVTAWGGLTWPVPVVSEFSREEGYARMAELAAITGGAAAEQIVRHYGGTDLYIPNCRKALRQLAQARLIDDYDRLLSQGLSATRAVFQLGQKYQMNYRSIQEALNRPSAVMTRPQRALF